MTPHDRVAAVYSLPFHRWVLEPAVSELRARGVEVEEVEHQPDGPHDWLSERTLRHARSPAPGCVLVADAPYGPLRQRWPGAPVVATRHSLASRGNTWDPVHLEADVVATWSTWDELEWGRRCLPLLKASRTGPVWAARLAQAQATQRGRSPRVTWAPSWNAAWSCRADVARALGILQRAGWIVRIRPHAVVTWREGGDFSAGVLPHLGEAPEWSDGAVPAHEDVLVSDVVLSDVSGFGLLCSAAPAGRVGVVQVTATDADLNTRPQQLDRQGPEWRYRDWVGAEVRAGAPDFPGRIAAAVEAQRTDAEARARRQELAEYLMGPDVAGAGERVAAVVQGVIRAGVRR